MSAVIRVWRPPANLPITLMYALLMENWFCLPRLTPPAPTLSFRSYRIWPYTTPLTVTCGACVAGACAATGATNPPSMARATSGYDSLACTVTPQDLGGSGLLRQVQN